MACIQVRLKATFDQSLLYWALRHTFVLGEILLVDPKWSVMLLMYTFFKWLCICWRCRCIDTYIKIYYRSLRKYHDGNLGSLGSQVPAFRYRRKF